MRYRRTAIAFVFAFVVVAAYVQTRPGRNAIPLPGTPLRTLGAADHLKIGTAVRADALKRDRAYGELVGGQFSSVTPENEMKWDATEPDPGNFKFADADRIMDFAQAAGEVVRGHTLVWHNQLPDYVRRLGPVALGNAMDEHIRGVMGHFAGRISAWDVVNEAITDHGAMRQSVFERELGDGYIARAFRTAHAADPHAALYINDYGAEGVNIKSDRLYAVVSRLKRDGVPIDGVGFQMHVNPKGVPPSFVFNMRRFAALGLQLSITEADVALKLPASAAELRTQARVYTTIVRDCRAVAACVSLTFWGFTDSRSWISETRAGFGAATLLSDTLRPKPAFVAVQRALRP